MIANVFMMCLISQDDTEFSVPSYPTRINESEEALRARLTYQSRKRGIAENCLILRFVLFLLVFMLTVGLINLGNIWVIIFLPLISVIFSTFFSEQGPNLPRKIVDQFDILINTVDSDWDLYYWMTGKELPPPPYDNEVLFLVQLKRESSKTYK